MKKIMAILLSALMLFSLCACTTPTDNEKYLVGIVQLEQHAALDAATKGFRDALVEKLMAGPDAFKGQDPIDSFCGLFDARL